ncbi:hypothetical protein BH09ACT7_BH09ACT7_19730 [soil metagenome]
MFVEPAEMRAGANTSYNAAWLANEGATALARATVVSGMFGGFAAAQDFGTALGAAHSQHLSTLRQHEVWLGTVGDQAHTGASAFIDMDQRNSQALQAVLWSSTQA